MKKEFRSFIIISTIILASILIAALSLKAVRNGETITEASLVKDQSFTLVDNSHYDFTTSNFGTVDYNNSIIVKDTLTINGLAGMEEVLATLGSVKNATNNPHGFIELYSFERISGNIQSSIYSTFVDSLISSDSEYLCGQISDKSLDGTKDQFLIVLLKTIDTTYFALDFLEYSLNGLILNYSLTISSDILESVKDFEIFDIDGDNKAELYLFGTNKTDTEMVLVELTYNTIQKNYTITNTFAWGNSNNQFIDLLQFTEDDIIYFIIAGIKTSPTLKSYTLSIGLEKATIRDFILYSNSSFSFGSDIFRVYNMKPYSIKGEAINKVALFGTIIDNGMENYPYCLIISYNDGLVAGTMGIRVEQTPDWSVDGLIIDINLDNTSEIIITTYDFTTLSLSDYGIYSNSGFTQIDFGETPLRRIRLSSSLTTTTMQIGMFVGKNDQNRDAISFYEIQHLPFKLKGNSEVLHENAVNEFRLEIYNYDGVLQARTDLTVDVSIVGDSNSEKIFTQLPQNFSYTFDELSSNAAEEKVFSIEISFDSLILYNSNTILYVNKLPEFSVKTPSKIIILRKVDSLNGTFELQITNNLQETLVANASIIPKATYRAVSTNFIINPNTESIKEIQFTFIGTIPASKYFEVLRIRFETTAGIFEISTEMIVTNKIAFTFNDMLMVFWIAVILVLIIYVGFGLAISKQTVQELDYYFSYKEPLELEYKTFKKQAINSLLRRYTKEGDWKAGLVLAEDYLPTFIPHFHKYRARDQLNIGQNLIDQGNFEDGLSYWMEAQKSLEKVSNHQYIDTLEWLMTPLGRIVEALKMKKGSEKINVLQKEFQNLNIMSGQTKVIYGITLDIPLYLVAEQLGLVLKDNEELQASLNYLQMAYQGAPNEQKNRIVSEITSLISLGVMPSEMSLPIDHEAIRERIEKRTIKCFSCGEERTNINEPCSNCGVDTVYCSVCKLPISFGADYLECTHCQNIAHKEHLLEWIKVKGTCPVCQQKLKPESLKVVGKKK
ncbi:MAG TPA: hypothetical protein VMZ29_04770 [Candidatus Bathyarchaeia archaeon]|nr:hypothetical protein [Candidatus Bathyarchaeia archaeon]